MKSSALKPIVLKNAEFSEEEGTKGVEVSTKKGEEFSDGKGSDIVAVSASQAKVQPKKEIILPQVERYQLKT